MFKKIIAFALFLAALMVGMASPVSAEEPPTPNTSAVRVSGPLPDGVHVRFLQHRKLPTPEHTDRIRKGIPKREDKAFFQAEIWSDDRKKLFNPGLLVRVRMCKQPISASTTRLDCIRDRWQNMGVDLNWVTTGEGVREGGSGHLIVSGTYPLGFGRRVYAVNLTPFVSKNVGVPFKPVEVWGRIVSKKDVFSCTNVRNLD